MTGRSPVRCLRGQIRWYPGVTIARWRCGMWRTWGPHWPPLESTPPSTGSSLCVLSIHFLLFIFVNPPTLWSIACTCNNKDFIKWILFFCTFCLNTPNDLGQIIYVLFVCVFVFDLGDVALFFNKHILFSQYVFFITK